MEQIELIKCLCSFFADVLNEQTEVVVHDMRSGEIVFIANGAVTGRTTGKTDQTSTIRLLAERAEHEHIPGRIIGYRSVSPKGNALRSSNLFLRGDDGDYRYSICINQDIAGLAALQSYLDGLLGTTRLEQPLQEEETVDGLIMNILLSELERVKPFGLDSREEKMLVLKRLDEKGVFDVRHAVPKVCELLQIAQPTLYKYLRELKAEEETAEIQPAGNQLVL